MGSKSLSCSTNRGTGWPKEVPKVSWAFSSAGGAAKHVRHYGLHCGRPGEKRGGQLKLGWHGGHTPEVAAQAACWATRQASSNQAGWCLLSWLGLWGRGARVRPTSWQASNSRASTAAASAWGLLQLVASYRHARKVGS